MKFAGREYVEGSNRKARRALRGSSARKVGENEENQGDTHQIDDHHTERQVRDGRSKTGKVRKCCEVCGLL